MNWIRTKDRLPENGETVIIFDGEIHIARFERGISVDEREKMKRGEIENPMTMGWNLTNGYFEIKRSETYGRADEGGNNRKPYCWIDQSGPMQWFGQYISYWMPLPEKPKGAK